MMGKEKRKTSKRGKRMDMEIGKTGKKQKRRNERREKEKGGSKREKNR